MRPTKQIVSIMMIAISLNVYSQDIGDFLSVNPVSQNDNFVIPSTHRFQKIIEVGDPLTSGGTLDNNLDFTGYVPISASSTNGYLSINHENAVGGVTVLDINFNGTTNLWETTASQPVDFSSYGVTRANCSGTVTPWNTVITCEEVQLTVDFNFDGYYDNGWNIEIDPQTKTVVNALYAMGNFAHENVTIHSNERTVYQGADSNPGYLYKFVADNAQDLTSGSLYVYTGPKSGSGNWVLLNNSTPAERNTTLTQSANAGGTVFNGVEDVEIGPDGKVYFAVKNESRVYRFTDSDPINGTTATMETFVGNMNYDIVHSGGTTSVPWGSGNDNLAFDGAGNLWVLQDGGNNYIWVVGPGHTQSSPDVRVFGIAPSGSEPTGITFTPDYKYLFMSIMHPSATNNANQVDAAGAEVDFALGTSLVIALETDLGNTLSMHESQRPDFRVYPNPVAVEDNLVLKGHGIEEVTVYDLNGKVLLSESFSGKMAVELNLAQLEAGTYLVRVNSEKTFKIIVE